MCLNSFRKQLRFYLHIKRSQFFLENQCWFSEVLIFVTILFWTEIQFCKRFVRVLRVSTFKSYFFLLSVLLLFLFRGTEIHYYFLFSGRHYFFSIICFSFQMSITFFFFKNHIYFANSYFLNHLFIRIYFIKTFKRDQFQTFSF